MQAGPKGDVYARKAGKCRCGAAVAPRQGSLLLQETSRAGRFRKQWRVLCARCA